MKERTFMKGLFVGIWGIFSTDIDLLDEVKNVLRLRTYIYDTSSVYCKIWVFNIYISCVIYKKAIIINVLPQGLRISVQS